MEKVEVITMKELLEVGMHFGHPTRRWNPKMKKFIYGSRNDVHIVDLQQTVKLLEMVYWFVRDLGAEGKILLFIGTKKQSQNAVEEAAKRAGQYWVNQRWLGGMLTNFETVRQRISRLEGLERMREQGLFERLPKKEGKRLANELEKLALIFNGIRKMTKLPDAVLITDLKKEEIGFKEAKKLGIPVIAIVDTNCDPDEVDYPIPGNDDAIGAIKLICDKMAEAFIAGREMAQAALEAAEEVGAKGEVVVGEEREAGVVTETGVTEELEGEEEEAE